MDFAIDLDRYDRERPAVADRCEGLLQFRRVSGREDEDRRSGSADSRHLALQMGYSLTVEIEGRWRTITGAEVCPSGAEGRLTGGVHDAQRFRRGERAGRTLYALRAGWAAIALRAGGAFGSGGPFRPFLTLQG
jgi:hypothetical protein